MATTLNGIAKGSAVDRLAEMLMADNIGHAIVEVDGAMQALGLHPLGQAWTIAIEAPDPVRRTFHSVLALQDAAVAKSGDYRRWVEVQGPRHSHAMVPERGAPRIAAPDPVTFVDRICAAAEAWTALMVLGPLEGAILAGRRALDALFLMRDDDGGARRAGIGRIFSEDSRAVASAGRVWAEWAKPEPTASRRRSSSSPWLAFLRALPSISPAW